MSLSLEPGLRLVAATHNPGKARELAALLEGRFDVVSAAALNLAEPEEPETTFVGNAIVKARAAADTSGLIALADDSGLCVAGLDGAPGIYSARWAGPDKDFGHAMDLVEARLADTGSDDIRAWFVCALAVAWPRARWWPSRAASRETWPFPAEASLALDMIQYSFPRAAL